MSCVVMVESSDGGIESSRVESSRGELRCRSRVESR